MTPAERRAEEANGRAKGGGEAEVTNAAGGDFGMHRRFVLAVALEVADRGGEVLTAGNTAGGGGVGVATASDGAVGGGVDFATAFDAAGRGAECVITAIDEATGEGVEVPKCLTQRFSRRTSMRFSHSLFSTEVMVLRLQLTRCRALL